MTTPERFEEDNPWPALIASLTLLSVLIVGVVYVYEQQKKTATRNLASDWSCKEGSCFKILPGTWLQGAEKGDQIICAITETHPGRHITGSLMRGATMVAQHTLPADGSTGITFANECYNNAHAACEKNRNLPFCSSLGNLL